MRMTVSMSTVWDRTSEVVSDNIAAFAAIAALTLYVPTAVQSITQPLAASAGTGGKLGLGLLSLLLTLVMLFGQTAVVALALEPELGRGGALARARSRLPAAIGLSGIVALATILLLVPPLVLVGVGGVGAASIAVGSMAGLSPATIALIALYLVVVACVIVWLGARLVVLASVVVAERRGVGALGRAFRLTRGTAVRIIGVLLLFAVVAVVAVLAAKTVAGSLFRLALGGEGAVNPALVLTALVTALVSTIATVVITAFFARLYLALRDRAEPLPLTA